MTPIWDIIVIRVAGLLAARELSPVSKQVIVLGARNRMGGRTKTIHDWMHFILW